MNFIFTIEWVALFFAVFTTGCLTSVAATRLQAEEKNGHYVAIGFIAAANNHTFEFVRGLSVRAKENGNWLLLNKMQFATN